MSTSVTAENTSMRRRLTARMDWRSNIIYIAFVVVFILFAVMLGNDGFLSGNNLLNIARQTATISIMAIAMTFVIAAAEIDLSPTYLTEYEVAAPLTPRREVARRICGNRRTSSRPTRPRARATCARTRWRSRAPPPPLAAARKHLCCLIAAHCCRCAPLTGPP